AHPQARARLREVRTLLKERTGPRPKQPTGAGRPPPRASPGGEGSVLRLDCPCCGAQGAVPWDRLGRLHACRRCPRSFGVDPPGGLVEVIRTRDNKWVDRAVHTARSRRNQAVRLVTRYVLPFLALAGGVLLVVWLSSRPATSAEVALPREL